MNDLHPVNPALVLAHAAAWIGTPPHRGQSARGLGADCVGLVRGIYEEVSGRAAPPAAFRHDWSRSGGDPILHVLARHLVQVPLTEARPGWVVTFRSTHLRVAHVGILDAGGVVIHADDRFGVCRVPQDQDRLSGAWAIPRPVDCDHGPAGLDLRDCVAVVEDAPGGLGPDGPARLSVQWLDGTPLAQSIYFQTRAAALDLATSVYQHVETME